MRGLFTLKLQAMEFVAQWKSASVTFSFFLIFSGAALFASIALYTRQPLIIAYIALGACIGPYGLSLVTDLNLLSDIGHVGIIFLLFLLGLDMQPQALWATLRKSTVVALLSSAVFLGTGFTVASCLAFPTWMPDRRRRHDVFLDNHRHQAAAHHRSAPSPYRRTDDRPAAAPGPAGDHCIDDPVKRGIG